MTIVEAIILGIVQGLFMFIPVSSTSHLALTQHWLIERGSELPLPSSPDLILFDLVVHVGTLVSIAFVFRKDLKRLITGFIADLKNLRSQQDSEDSGRYLRLFWLGMLSVFVTGIVGSIIYVFGRESFNAPLIIAFNLVVTGAILWWTDTAGPGKKSVKDISPRMVAVIGLAQGLALLPGLSRSGLTIAAALLVGLKRRWAAEFSFFIAIPTILAASLVQLLIVSFDSQPLLVAPGAFVVGFIVSAIFGTGSLLAVLWLLYRARFRVFSYYVWLLALLTVSGSILSV